MFLNSKYQILFSKPKKSVLFKIEESLFKGFPDYDGKKFKGKVTNDGFKVKVMGNGYLSFRGKFVPMEDNEECLEVSVGVKYFDVLIFVILFILFLPLYTDRDVEAIYGFLSVCVGLAIFIAYSYKRNSKNTKEIFFDVLKNFDKDCKIISVNKSIF